MTNAQSFASRELDILEKTVPDALITPFREEILALCEAFGKSGQSGGSGPSVATALSKAIKHLLLFEPICALTDFECEWIDQSRFSPGETFYQHSRCSALFKTSLDGEARYCDAIVWNVEGIWEEHFTGPVYLDRSFDRVVSSAQTVVFPFSPKSFYIDVVMVPVGEELGDSPDFHSFKGEHGHYTYVVKDRRQLSKVWKYYKETSSGR